MESCVAMTVYGIDTGMPIKEELDELMMAAH